jgi:hypothetical protein
VKLTEVEARTVEVERAGETRKKRDDKTKYLKCLEIDRKENGWLGNGY